MNTPLLLRARQVLRDQQGTALVELGFLLPLFIFICVATLYFSDLIIAMNRVSAASDAIATTAALESCLSDNDDTRTAIFNGARALLPHGTEVQALVLTSLAPELGTDNIKTGNWSVQWSRAAPGAAIASYGFSPAQAEAFKAEQWDKPLMIAQVKVTYRTAIPLLGDLPAWNISRESVVPAFDSTANCAP
ncbi:TadE/TadG family type IV pilus assembly protein [Xanthobacter sp. TB0139]|uniref:TadE/TadG family type IV pilus assembly protein n=1 Tax=Xanthobacter sp. TB0139 TaxID=3459178 RepID=UPI0040395371